MARKAHSRKIVGPTGVTKAIGAIQTDKVVHIGFNVDDIPQMKIPGDAIQTFAGGGVVLPFRGRGTDTVPAMLSPGDVVLTRAQQARLLNGGGPGVSTARLEAQNEEMLQWLRHERVHANANIARIVMATVQTAGLRR